jgi:hypothetical protein
MMEPATLFETRILIAKEEECEGPPPPPRVVVVRSAVASIGFGPAVPVAANEDEDRCCSCCCIGDTLSEGGVLAGVLEDVPVVADVSSSGVGDGTFPLLLAAAAADDDTTHPSSSLDGVVDLLASLFPVAYTTKHTHKTISKRMKRTRNAAPHTHTHTHM